MDSILQTEKFEIRCKESPIGNDILWESHCHAQFEAISVIDGDISILQEGRSYRLTANQTAILPPLSYHTVTANQKGFYRRTTVLFDTTSIPPPLLPHFADMKTASPILLSDHGKRLTRIVCAEKPQFYAPLADSLMTELLYLYAEGEHVGSNPQIDETLLCILSYIDAHLCEKIRLSDIASHTALSESSVCHIFTEKMQISPKQYILEKKLALAASLIHSGTPPTLVAIRIGYENYSSFYRMYLKHFGKSPGER